MAMQILVINPNTSVSMTARILSELERVKSPEAQLTVVNPDRGPRSIESAYDEAHAVPPTLELAGEAERQGRDAVVLACFSDPGLEAAREIVSIPVVGLGESSFHLAAKLGHKFSVLTSSTQRVPSKVRQVASRGLTSLLASVRPLEMSVLAMDAQPTRARDRLLEMATRAVREDGAEVVVLGCAGLTGHAEPVERELNVTVIDPSTAALKMAELLVGLGLKPSKRGLYAAPVVTLAR